MRELVLDHYLLEDCADAADVQLYDEYSGRGMYGNTCVGIVGSHSGLIKFLFELVREVKESRFEEMQDNEVEDLQDFLADNLCIDSMGLDKIFYWPRFSMKKDEE